MPISKSQAQNSQAVGTVIDHYVDIDHESNNPNVDLERLAEQLQRLQRSSKPCLSQQHQRNSYAASSSGYSDDGSDRGYNSTGIDTPPALTGSHCSTPSNGDSVSPSPMTSDAITDISIPQIPRTPSNVSQMTIYSPSSKSLSGAGKLRLSSPLATGQNSLADLQVPDAIAEEEARPPVPQIPEYVHPKARQSLAASVVAESLSPQSEISGRIRSSTLSGQQARSRPSTRPSSARRSSAAVEYLAPPTRARSSSLPEVADFEQLSAWFRVRNPARDLVVPDIPTEIDPQVEVAPKPEDEIEVIGRSYSQAASPTEATARPKKLQKKRRPQRSPTEKTPTTDGSQDSKASIWSRAKDSFVSTYYPSEAPPLILPTGPTDLEKTLYLKTNRLGLYTFGVFSFLSLSVGMWLFVISFVGFYWFGALVFLLQLYLIISYTVSICGKDYDIEKHNKILLENPVNQLTAPTVDIYLPCCKEPIEVLENTYKHIQQLQYPNGKVQVYVLDDGASDAVKAMATEYGFEYICREDRPRLKKAGNLRWAFARTEGDFFAIFDAVSTTLSPCFENAADLGRISAQDLTSC